MLFESNNVECLICYEPLKAVIARKVRLQLFKFAHIRRCVKLSSGTCIYFTQTKVINRVPQGNHSHINSLSLFQLAEQQTAEIHKLSISQLDQ